MKQFIFISLCTLMLANCGGDDTLKPTKKELEPKSILTKNHWYEQCIDSNGTKISKEYIFNNVSFIYKQYSDSNFTKESNKTIYNAKYTESGVDIERSLKESYTCSLGAIGESTTKKSTIDSIIVSCFGKKNKKDDKPTSGGPVFSGDRTKELAKQNISDCI